MDRSDAVIKSSQNKYVSLVRGLSSKKNREENYKCIIKNRFIKNLHIKYL